MTVTLLYFDGCPNWQEAEDRLHEAMRRAGRPVSDLRAERVITPEDAQRLRFRGSPTILVDGEDPFADAAAPVGLACRLFQTPDGLLGAPTVEQLVAAMR
ncbi:DF family (seleno)protein [Aquipuribacter hungaricus]|uniref:Thioredoxin family protein n=1 Tax=Aquipuribacter hungaricus TaxID=545624 RepID=A0ABV7WGL6_9MICO